MMVALSGCREKNGRAPDRNARQRPDEHASKRAINRADATISDRLRLRDREPSCFGSVEEPLMNHDLCVQADEQQNRSSLG
jgi:hypothetical protein